MRQLRPVLQDYITSANHLCGKKSWREICCPGLIYLSSYLSSLSLSLYVYICIYIYMYIYIYIYRSVWKQKLGTWMPQLRKRLKIIKQTHNWKSDKLKRDIRHVYMYVYIYIYIYIYIYTCNYISICESDKRKHNVKITKIRKITKNKDNIQKTTKN